tara:strand:- start:105 stop:353 length:249 start_codon:yes stop_codon:yes gene_type:complete
MNNKDIRKEIYDLLKDNGIDIYNNTLLRSTLKKLLQQSSATAIRIHLENIPQPRFTKRKSVSKVRVYIKEPPATDDELSLIS